MQHEGERHQFSITSSFEDAADLAEQAGLLCAGQPGSGPDLAEVLRLCLAEALNNIVEHAYGGTEGRPIHADLSLSPGGFEICLIDEGIAMPGGQPPDGTLPDGIADFDAGNLDALPEGGFGWMLIRTEMDLVNYERRDGCNVLRLGKSLDA